MVAGFDNGDGVRTRFAASDDELLGGMFTNLGKSGLLDLSSVVVMVEAGLLVGGDALEFRLAD